MAEKQESLGHTVVVGGCGFLGSHIVKLLLSRHPKTKISILDLRIKDQIPNPQTSYHSCDITDAESLLQLFKELKPDVVIHTASSTAFLPKDITYKINVEGTKNLLKAAQETGVKAFVYTSSASVIMGEMTEMINVDERWPVVIGDRQPEYYSHTKAVAEMAVLEANRSSKTFLTCAIRPAAIFGEGDVQLLPPMVKAAKSGQSKFQLGSNDNLFDFTYVGNIAHAHLLAAVGLLATAKLNLSPLDTERIDGEAFFITNDSPVYLWDFAHSVYREAGATTGVDPNSVWHIGADFAITIAGLAEWALWLFGKTPNLTRSRVRYSTLTRYYNISKAKERLGYAPIVGLEEGIKRGVKDVLARDFPEK
ncbi:uncharacterized protein PV09_01664 [Verruconis gallopava]|uniref:Sterol-4-alpha-carboxylate 3-dehydrogenase ERG26, decarboxylating n=1 Tax=Verruconis gallopava TaxID=253628 RepID=A0A0D2B903_9PEZI|nr:uncharacterized protein PV09_01664 [Verruconis gallopava]KIW07734.1 hypothetical protein PV09_01664 [Verruconis gallopava]